MWQCSGNDACVVKHTIMVITPVATARTTTCDCDFVYNDAVNSH